MRGNKKASPRFWRGLKDTAKDCNLALAAALRTNRKDLARFRADGFSMIRSYIFVNKLLSLSKDTVFIMSHLTQCVVALYGADKVSVMFNKQCHFCGWDGGVVLNGTTTHNLSETLESTTTGRFLHISGGMLPWKSQRRIVPGVGRYLIAISHVRNHDTSFLSRNRDMAMEKTQEQAEQ